MSRSMLTTPPDARRPALHGGVRPWALSGYAVSGAVPGVRAVPAASPGARSTRSPEPLTAVATATPLVRRLAEHHGVDLAAVAGTGAGGRRTRGDVFAAAGRTGATTSAAPHPQRPDDGWFPGPSRPAAQRHAAAAATTNRPARPDPDDGWFPGAPSAAELRAASPETRALAREAREWQDHGAFFGRR